MVSVVQWAIFANSPIFMDPPDGGLDLVVASGCLLDHKSNQEATMPQTDHADADRLERVKVHADGHEGHAHAHDASCGHSHDAHDHDHAHDGRGHSHAHTHGDAGSACCGTGTAAAVAE